MSFSDLPSLLASVPAAYLLAVAVPLSVIDVRQRRLPNKLVLPGVVVAIVFDLLASILGDKWLALVVAFAYLVGAFAVFLLANMIGAIGMGDVKLISLICMSLGWFDWTWPLLALGAGFGVASLSVLFSMLAGKLRSKNTIPLGPYLLFGFGVSFTALVVS